MQIIRSGLIGRFFLFREVMTLIDKNSIRRYHSRRDERLKSRGFRMDWEESKHPRGKDGKFTSGAGSSSKIQVGGPKASKGFIDDYIKKNPEIKKEASKYKGALEKVKNFDKDHPGIKDGTYDVFTGEPVEQNDGYCVTFHQNLAIGDEFGGYDDDDYARMCAIAVKELGCDKPNIGRFGNPEISFNCKDFGKAKDFAIKHNQHSVYDVANDDLWINPHYDRSKNPIEGK